METTKAITKVFTDSDSLTKLDFFALHAPDAIPDFFQCEELPVPERPDDWTSFEEEDPYKQIVREWHWDGIIDLPEELQWYQQKWENYSKTLEEVKAKNIERRYFQWRQYFAEQLLKQLSSKQK